MTEVCAIENERLATPDPQTSNQEVSPEGGKHLSQCGQSRGDSSLLLRKQLSSWGHRPRSGRLNINGGTEHAPSCLCHCSARKNGQLYVVVLEIYLVCRASILCQRKNIEPKTVEDRGGNVETQYARVQSRRNKSMYVPTLLHSKAREYEPQNPT